MAEHSILFSAPMVKALLAGTKTQTRRVLKPQPFIDDMGNFCVPRRKGVYWNYGQHIDGRPCVRNFAEGLPIKVGGRLWVKEAWADEHPLSVQEGRYSQEGQAGIPGPPAVAFRTIYRVDGEPLQVWRNRDHSYPYFTLDGPADETAVKFPEVCSNFTRDGKAIHWENPRYMPRWASRLTLTVTDVRVQRLQDITEGDARAEGTQEPSLREMGGDFAQAAWSERQVFQRLWDSINSRRGLGWAANPWVAAYTFTVDRQNIDAVPA